MLKVTTQGIAKCVERWSFVSMGEDGVERADYMYLQKANQLS